MSQSPMPPYGAPEPPPPAPGYAPPGYGAPAAPAAVAPKKKSGAAKVLLIALAAVVLLCVGGVAVAAFALKDTAKEVADVARASDTRLVAPATLAGRPKITDPALQSAADQMSSSLKTSVPNATSTIGAFYGDPANQDMVVVAGLSAPVVQPAKQLDEAIASMGASGLTLTNVAAVDPGPLGGSAKCGDAEAQSVKIGLCLWADHGSVGVVGLYFKSAAEAKAEFVKIRGEVETRG
jgi:flagellar basal body-associated protein FliL